MEVSLEFLLGMFAGALAVYAVVKYRLHQVRQLLDVVDDALYDDKVSDEEFAAIWKAVKVFWEKKEA